MEKRKETYEHGTYSGMRTKFCCCHLGHTFAESFPDSSYHEVKLTCVQTRLVFPCYRNHVIEPLSNSKLWNLSRLISTNHSDAKFRDLKINEAPRNATKYPIHWCLLPFRMVRQKLMQGEGRIHNKLKHAFL